MSNVWEQTHIGTELDSIFYQARHKLEEAALEYGRADTRYGYTESEGLRRAAEEFELAHRNREQFYESIKHGR